MRQAVGNLEIKEAKDAVLEELDANRKYRYPSIESLNEQLSNAYTNARNAKTAIADLTAQKTIEKRPVKKIGAFTSKWWTAAFGILGSATAGRDGNYGIQNKRYSTRDAYQDDVVSAIRTIADMNSQARINSAWAELGKMNKTGRWMHLRKVSVPGMVVMLAGWTIRSGQRTRMVQSGIIKALKSLKTADIHKTWHYAQYHNSETKQQQILTDRLSVALMVQDKH